MAENHTSNWLGYVIVGGAMLYFYFHSPSIGSHVMQRQNPPVPKIGHSFQGVIQFRVSPLSGYEDKRPMVLDKTGQSLVLRPANTLQLSLEVPCKFKVPDSDRIKVTARWSLSETQLGTRLLAFGSSLQSAAQGTQAVSPPPMPNTPPTPSLSLSAAGFDANPLVQQDTEWSWSLRPKNPGRQEVALTVTYPSGYKFSSPFLLSSLSAISNRTTGSTSGLTVAQKCSDETIAPEYVTSEGKSQLVLATRVADEFGLTPRETTVLRIVGTGAVGIVGWILQQLFKSLFTKDKA